MIQWKFGKILCQAILAVALWSANAGVQAATFVVNSTGDTNDAKPGNGLCANSKGKCSLRAAIQEANARPGWDLIYLGTRVTYVLSKGEISITDDVDIFGKGSVIDANQASRIFHVTVQRPNCAYLDDLTIRNGSIGSGFGGGALKIDEPSDVSGYRLNVSDSRSTSLAGGGVENSGSFLCSYCKISNNRTNLGTAGGVQSSGGGIFNYSAGKMWLYSSTFTQNEAVRGGAIAGAGYLEMQTCTLSGNKAARGGGALRTMYTNANWAIAFSTITANQAGSDGVLDSEPSTGGGIHHAAGTLNIGKTIVAGNTGPFVPFQAEFSPDCATASGKFLVSHRDNIFGNMGNVDSSPCRAIDATGGDWIGDRAGSGQDPIDPNLGALRIDQGDSYTSSHPLLSGSVAIDDVTSGNPTGFWLYDCPAQDQTRRSRPVGGFCDVGSFEYR